MALGPCVSSTISSLCAKFRLLNVCEARFERWKQNFRIHELALERLPNRTMRSTLQLPADDKSAMCWDLMDQTHYEKHA